MSAPAPTLAEAVEALAADVAALPRSASLDAVGAALARALSLLARPTLPRAADVVPMIQGAAHVLMRLAAEGVEGVEAPLAAAARATDALFDASDRAFALGELARAGAPLPSWPRATRARPALLRPERASFTWPGAPPTEPLAVDAPDEDLSDPPPPADLDADAPELPPRAPANDLALPAAHRARLRLDEGGEPRPAEAFHARALGACLDALGMLGKQRWARDLADRAPVEARILAYTDAAAITGGDLVARVLAWWEASLERPDPWPTWAAAFFLGLLDGDDALVAVVAGLEKLPAEALAQGMAVADALSVSPHPSVATLAKHLVASPHALSRAAGLHALRARAPLAPDELRRHLLDPGPAVQHAALRAARALTAEEAAPLLPLVRVSFGQPHAAVAREAARALLGWGDLSPYDALVSDERVAARLGLHAAEILVQHGRAADLPLLQRILRRAPASPAHLSIVARFGHPGAWAYLLHHLADSELADDAAGALEALFGARVDETERESAPAWRAAVEALAPSPDARYAGGEPWHPRLLARRLAAGALPAAQAELLHDELAARVGLRAPLALANWAPDEAAARAASADAVPREGRYPAGRWASVVG